jgi:N6-L-threonylcarbamoyladenine synthase
LILGLECSFNDSCAAVVSSTGKVLSNTKKTFPKSNQPDALTKATSFHAEQLPMMIEKALSEAQVSDIKKLEAVAVALGPGQADNLRVGIDLAQAIGAKYDIPVIPVNHLEAHVMTKRLEAVA